jgi:hypothetical protein
MAPSELSEFESRDTIPAPPPGDLSEDFPDDCEVTVPDLRPWMEATDIAGPRPSPPDTRLPRAAH